MLGDLKVNGMILMQRWWRGVGIKDQGETESNMKGKMMKKVCAEKQDILQDQKQEG